MKQSFKSVLTLLLLTLVTTSAFAKKRSLAEDLERLEQEEYEAKEKEQEEYQKEMNYETRKRRLEKPKQNPTEIKSQSK